MKTLRLIFVILTVIAFGCKGGGSKPGDVYKDALLKIEDGKYEEVISMMAKEDGTVMTDEETEKTMGMLGIVNATIKNKKGIKSIEILEEKLSEDGNKADIEYKVTFGNGEINEEDSELIKVDGQWKLLGL